MILVIIVLDNVCIAIFLLCILFSTLQESELESIQIQSNIDQLQEEKERLLNSVVESE